MAAREANAAVPEKSKDEKKKTVDDSSEEEEEDAAPVPVPRPEKKAEPSQEVKKEVGKSSLIMKLQMQQQKLKEKEQVKDSKAGTQQTFVEQAQQQRELREKGKLQAIQQLQSMKQQHDQKKERELQSQPAAPVAAAPPATGFSQPQPPAGLQQSGFSPPPAYPLPTGPAPPPVVAAPAPRVPAAPGAQGQGYLNNAQYPYQQQQPQYPQPQRGLPSLAGSGVQPLGPLPTQPQQYQQPAYSHQPAYPQAGIDSLQPQLARNPAAVADPPVKPARKRKRREVDVPEIDLNNKDTFSIISLSTKFSKWLAKCIKNGSNTFTKGDAQQVIAYAEKHCEHYFALKEGWVRFLKSLDDETEIFKAWYAYDCLISMPEFKNPAVRATWEVRLPELITEYMELTDLSENREKYTKLILAWRSRVDPETMVSIRSRLSNAGISLPDTITGNQIRFRHKVGTTLQLLSDVEATWINVKVKEVNTKGKTVVFSRLDGPSTEDITMDLLAASRNTRRPNQKGEPAKKAARTEVDVDGTSPAFD